MRRIFKRIFLTLAALLALALLLTGIEYFGGQPMGLFAGSRPANLGYSSGKFAPPSWKPNCVLSTVEKSDSHYIEPLAISGAAADMWKKLQSLVKSHPRTAVVSENATYLYAEFKSAGMGFVDDVEFALDEKTGVIQVRSASRLGVRDLGVNRARVESIRSQLAK